MKNILIIILILGIITACNQQIDSENASQEAKEQAQQQTEQLEAKDFGKIGFKLMETETLDDLKIGLTVEEVEKRIGKAEEFSEFEIWDVDGFEHQNRIYQQESIDLDFVKLEDGRIVSNMITILNNCPYKTSRDIGIGSTYEAVFVAYQKEISMSDNKNKKTLIAGTIYGGIIFQFENEKVKTIFIGAAAE